MDTEHAPATMAALLDNLFRARGPDYDRARCGWFPDAAAAWAALDHLEQYQTDSRIEATDQHAARGLLWHWREEWDTITSARGLRDRDLGAAQQALAVTIARLPEDAPALYTFWCAFVRDHFFSLDTEQTVTAQTTATADAAASPDPAGVAQDGAQ